MLIRHILCENEITDKIHDDLMDFLLAYRQANVNSVEIFGPTGVVTYLNNLGHDFDPDTIDELLAEPAFQDIVERSTEKIIELKPEKIEPTIAPDQEELSQEKVNKTAAKVAKAAVKAGDEI